MVELSEKMLTDAGGWQAIKHARALVDMNRVISSNYTPPLLKGLVREGETEYRAGLKIVTKTNIENICTCRQSREWGTLCPHSLAVGLAVVLRKQAAERPTPPPIEARPAIKSRFVSSIQPAAKLHFILPPSLETAWERGKIMLGIEAERFGKRVMLQAFEPGKQVTLSDEDAAAIASVTDALGAEPGGMTILERDQFLKSIEGLKGHPRITLGKSKPVKISPEVLKPKLEVRIQPNGAVAFQCRLQGQAFTSAGGVWLWNEDTLTQLTPGLPLPYHQIYSDEIKLEPAAGEAFLAGELDNLRNYFQLVIEGKADKAGRELKILPGIPQVALSIEGSLNHLAAQLQCIYGKRIITAGVTSAGERFTYESAGERWSRNPDFERAALQRLTRWGFQGPDTTGHYVLKGQPSILAFFARELPKLQKEWSVDIGSRFEHVTSQVERITPNVEIKSSGEDWLELGFSLAAPDGERFAAADIHRLLQSGQSHTKLRNGKIAVFDSDLLNEFEEVLRDCEPNQMRPGQYRVKKMHAGYLGETFADHPEIHLQADSSWRNSAKLGAAKEIAPVPLGALDEVLRPYQKHGVYWMDFLAKNGLSGVLADEMGLGKTLQTLAYLSLYRDKGTALVVCPTTLVENWRREAERFVPSLKVLIIDGPDRAKHFPQIPSASLVITSYALLRRDIDNYREFKFRVIVLDEAQHIKNPDTQNAQAAIALRSDSRMVLTGTPMENSVRDLWSIYQFLMPGYLGRREDFKERYEAPMSREADAAEASKRLRRRLKPFLLRRTKKEVAPELPDKIEQVVLCNLSPKQASVYEELLKASREKINDALGTKDRNRGRMLMLTALLRLRQACCDLRLLELEATEEASGKLESLRELLDEALDGGHRVLLFSQFVEMLSLLREHLESRDVRYAYLDGSTKNRMEVVDQFQNSADIPIFLISLKAGGVGLNLTAADTVIHYDPWWNPAVEAQATDRAHRIGQKNIVTSYKLITRGTVEEKILNLQNKKKVTIGAVVESESAFEAGLSFDEIRELFD